VGGKKQERHQENKLASYFTQILHLFGAQSSWSGRRATVIKMIFKYWRWQLHPTLHQQRMRVHNSYIRYLLSTATVNDISRKLNQGNGEGFKMVQWVVIHLYTCHAHVFGLHNFNKNSGGIQL